jgi:hypothetical protein
MLGPKHETEYAYQWSNTNYQTMLYTSDVRGLRDACHWLAINLVGNAAVIHLQAINNAAIFMR